MTKGNFLSTEERFFEVINQYTDEKHKLQKRFSKPKLLLKEEFEAFVESAANSFGIQYEKDFSKTTTVYWLSLSKHKAKIEVNYRFGRYYTRHHIQILQP
ncbi:hypothetical protein GJU40_01035 [Bacillus lacus]|uniref:Uncharacterized protein n=1 Tax=Metabacillus lacus TaxID=1983721 RepID=A0A7X2IVW6_9BACI|nr:hypothetical protein [Metabacillus lacus]MRX70751.1 hypothetical protein [Metabacillus lacus]